MSRGVTGKLRAKHGVSAEEVEEVVFEDEPRYRRGRANSLLGLGQTTAGRYLFIVLAKVGRGGRYRVLTARDMVSQERSYYERLRGR